MKNKLIEFYNEELISLQDTAVQFGKDNPSIAEYLQKTDKGIIDPHVERLLEGTAFLNGRMRCLLEDDKSELVNSLLEILYPDYQKAIPSMAIMQYQPTADNPEKSIIPRGELVETDPFSGHSYSFRTCYETNIWPVKVENLRQSPRKLHLTLTCLDKELNFSDLQIDSLRFYLQGNQLQSRTLYKFLLEKVVSVKVIDSLNPEFQHTLDLDAIKSVGFKDNESLLPRSSNVFSKFSLLSEYFSFPQKFMFLDFNFSDKKTWSNMTNQLTLEIEFEELLPKVLSSLTKESFSLACTPIINLFDLITEPVLVDGNKLEYPVIADKSKIDSIEIYSLNKVFQQNLQGDLVELIKFSSLDHKRNAELKMWSTVQRQKYQTANQSPLTVNSTNLVLIEPDLQTVEYGREETLNLEATCFNGNLPNQLANTGKFPGLQLVNGGDGVDGLKLLTLPTAVKEKNLEDDNSWRILAHLSLNYTGFSDPKHCRDTLESLLALYNNYGAGENKILMQAIKQVSTKQSIERLARAGVNNYCYGTELHLEFDKEKLHSVDEYLFSSVLEDFMATYSHVNSFSKLVITSKGEVIKAWKPRTGTGKLL